MNGDCLFPSRRWQLTAPAGCAPRVLDQPPVGVVPGLVWAELFNTPRAYDYARSPTRPLCGIACVSRSPTILKRHGRHAPKGCSSSPMSGRTVIRISRLSFWRQACGKPSKSRSISSQRRRRPRVNPCRREPKRLWNSKRRGKQSSHSASDGPEYESDARSPLFPCPEIRSATAWLFLKCPTPNRLLGVLLASEPMVSRGSHTVTTSMHKIGTRAGGHNRGRSFVADHGTQDGQHDPVTHKAAIFEQMARNSRIGQS